MAACQQSNITYTLCIRSKTQTKYETCFVLDDYIVSRLHFFNDLDTYDVYIIIENEKYECDIINKVNEYNICFLKPKLTNPNGLFNNVNHESFLMTSMIPNGTEQYCTVKYTSNENPSIKSTSVVFDDISFNKLIRQTAPYAPTYEFKMVENHKKCIDLSKYYGGIVSDENDKIIAMIISVNTKTKSLIGIPSYLIMSFVDKINMACFNTNADIYSVFFENFTTPITIKKKKYEHGLMITNIDKVPKTNKFKLNVNDIIVSINGNKIVEDGFIKYMNICMPASTYIMLQPEIINIPMTIIRNKDTIDTKITSLMSLNDTVMLPLYGSLKENIIIEQFGLELVQLSENLLTRNAEKGKKIVGIARDIYNGINDMKLNEFYVVKNINIELIQSNQKLQKVYEKHYFPNYDLCDTDNSYILFLLTKINNKKLKKKLSDCDISDIHTMTFVTTDPSQSIKVSIK